MAKIVKIKIVKNYIVWDIMNFDYNFQEKYNMISKMTKKQSFALSSHNIFFELYS